jgi:hypothetical protein
MEGTMTAAPFPVDSGVALRWIDDSLRHGGRLSRAVRDALDLTAGSVAAVVPRPEFAGDPSTGFGKRDASSRLLREFLACSFAPTTWLVVEDEMLRRSDHADPRDFGTRVTFCGDEVIHTEVLGAFSNGADLEEFLNWATTGHPMNGFLIPAGLLPSDSETEIDEAAIHSAVQVVRMAVIGAYDADGFLLWMPPVSAP